MEISGDENNEAPAKIGGHARSWKRDKLPKRAKEYYQLVIDTFPGSSFAETASEELAMLGR